MATQHPTGVHTYRDPCDTKIDPGRALTFQSGYELGTDAGNRFLVYLRAQRATKTGLPPNTLAMALSARMVLLEDAGGQTMARKPMVARTPEFEALRGEFHGFCVVLMNQL